MLLMMALVVPAFNGISGGTNFTEVSYDITGILDQARAYAMANRTYVYVGIGEFDVSQSSGAIPQNPGKGRVAVAVVASKDGTQDFANAVTQQGLDWQTNYGTPGQPGYDGGNLIAISKLRHFENVHLASSLPIPSSGPMERPAVTTSYTLGDPTCVSQTPFAWPLGSSLNNGYQYLFNKVIQFDPQGVARITYTNNSDTITQWMEIDLQQTHGTVVFTGSNVGAVQIDAMTGATRIYRP